MSKKITTESFIVKAKSIHGNKYNYSKVEYKKAIEKVVINCPIHGDFQQTPNAHLSKHGCRKCGNNSNEKWSREHFISEVLKRNNGFLPYEIIGEYLGTTKNIIVENNYGKCSIRANHVLNGVVPTIESVIDKTEYWKNQAKEVHGDKYDYSKVKYINSSFKITIICKQHGEFLQVPNSHLAGKGCGKCMKKVGGLKRTEQYVKEFKDRANKIHKDKYTYYGNTIFKSKDYITISCSLHGDFSQIADNHLKGDGCQKCALLRLVERMRENPTGWNHSNWQKAGESSKNFDSFKVYVIRCWNDDEEFYKIGKTFKTIVSRFKNNYELPYEYTIIKEINFDNAKEASRVENILKNYNKDNKYLPLKNFSGQYECFKELDNSCFELLNDLILLKTKEY